jgi:hypothetical protein
VRNCTIAGNMNDRRGAVYATGSGGVVNCVIAGNTLNSTSGPLWTNYSRISDCTVDAVYEQDLASASITTCRVGTPGAIFKNFASGDYRLASGSPASNAGPHVNPADYPAFDLEGRPRVLGGRIDHGCYEANPPGTLLLLR